MDPKTIAFGIAVITASIGGSVLVTSKPTTQLSVVAGGTATDETVTAIAKVGSEISERNCCLEREGTQAGVQLAWVCNGARMPAKDQIELSKLAGSAGSCVRFVPKTNGAQVTFDAIVINGTKPTLEPAPEKPVEVIPKP